MLRDYQQKKVPEIVGTILRHGVAYLVGEMRTGKTLVSLYVASRITKKFCLFITTKGAISSIESDIKKSGLGLDIQVVNYEQMHKITRMPDFIIYDEAHKMGAFPVPSKRTKLARMKFAGVKTLLLSGTPSPESFSQLYHQFWVTGKGPWTEYRNFYAWAKSFVIPNKIYIGFGRQIADYSKTIPKVMKDFEPYRITMTRSEAENSAQSFGKIIESFHELPLPTECKEMIRELRRTRISRSVIADTASKLMMSIHQISSGTYIGSEGRKILSDFKVRYIKDKFAKKKIAIFYVFIAEGDLLKKHFPNWTDDPDEFKKGNKVFIRQIVSGREGIDLSTADDLIMFNISFSAVSYWQGRERPMAYNIGDKEVHWLFTDLGIEKKIYEVVSKKKNYTRKHFNERDFDTI